MPRREGHGRPGEFEQGSDAAERLVRSLGRLGHGRQRGRQILSVLVDPLKHLQLLHIDELIEQHGVVEFARGKPSTGALRPDQSPILGLELGEQPFSPAELFGLGQGRGVQRLQTLGRPRHTRRQLQLPAPARLGPAGDIVVLAVLPAEKDDRGPMAGKIGQGLVKCGVAGQIKRGVEQFVKNHVGQRFRVIVQQMRQQRVIKPAQGTEGRGGADGGIVTPGFEAARFCPGQRLVEIALIGHPTDNREPPRIRLKAGLRRGGQHMDERRTADLGQAGVAAADAEAEFAFGKGPDAQHEAQLVPRRRIEIGPPQDVADRATVSQDSGLFIAKPEDIHRRAG